MGLLGTPRSCLYDFTHTKHVQAVTHSWRTMPRVPSRQRESIGERVGVERHRGSLFPRKGCFHAFCHVFRSDAQLQYFTLAAADRFEKFNTVGFQVKKMLAARGGPLARGRPAEI